MHKRLIKKITHTSIFTTFMGITTLAVQAGPNPMVDYLNNSGTPPSTSSQQCGSLCVNNRCNADLANKAYTCFNQCSQHTSATISSCANRQFQAYLQDLHTKLNALLQLNTTQGQQIVNLNNQLVNAQHNADSLRANLQGRNQELDQQLQAAQGQIATLSAQIANLTNQNNTLSQDLQNAQSNLHFHGTNTAALQAQLQANEAEINRLHQELTNMGNFLGQIMKDYGDIVDKYQLLGTFINTTADKVHQSEVDMQAITQDFAAALQKDRASIDAWVQANGKRLDEIQKNYANRTKEYSDFIAQAMKILEEQRGDITADINKLLQDYNQ